jgi:hypothetical protein
MVITYVAVFTSFYYFLFKIRRKKLYNRKEKFFSTLEEGLKSEAINTIDDVINIYKGVSRLDSEDLDYRYGLSKQLREFLVNIISNEVDNSLSNEQIIRWKQMISEIIKKNEEISPYADLPNAERNILSDILIFLEKNDSESIKRKTLELSGLIQARNDDFNRVKNINKWTIPLSIIGFILTILLGVLAFIKK